MTLLEPSLQERLALGSMLTGIGGDPYRLTVVIPGNPQPQQRARGGRGGRHYTPDASRAAQETIATLLMPFRNLDFLQGNLALACIFFRSTAHIVDGDNLLKLVQDAGTKARVWRDDSQITGGAYRIGLDRRNPRTLIAVAQHTSSMPRHLTALPDS